MERSRPVAGPRTAGGAGPPLGQHPADRLIRDLVRTAREVSTDELRQIVERVATAGYNTRPVRVPKDERGVAYRGHILSAREPSAIYHLVKRVAIEGQWAEGTTFAQYLADLRRAARASSARLALYQYRGEHIAATTTPTEAAVPPGRRGAESLPNLLVVYSADRGIIVTGYQFSALDQVDIPEAARWLK